LPSREDIVLSITSSLVFTPVEDWREFLAESTGADSRIVEVRVGMIVLWESEVRRVLAGC
jgi:hypothetical protein